MHSMLELDSDCLVHSSYTIAVEKIDYMIF